MRQVISALAALVLVSGCGTTVGSKANFAPPVNHAEFATTLDGGLDLLNRQIVAYRDQGSRLSNGRQLFDVPAMIVGLGGATAMALGASPDVAVGAGAFTGLSNSAKGYYKPSDRADAYYDAVHALVCTQQVAVGLSAIAPIPQRDKRNIISADGNLAGVPVDDHMRAFLLLKNSAVMVEQTLQSRLSGIGTAPDPAALQALIEKLIKETEATPEENSERMHGYGLAGASKAEAQFRLNLEKAEKEIALCLTLAK